MAGRTPKPTALKIIAGNPGKRPLNKREPQPDILQDLAPPAHLTPAAAEVWNEFAGKLSAVRVLTELDALALEMACNAIALYRQAIQQMDGNQVAMTRDGGLAKSPWVAVQAEAYKQAIALLRDFGMTPAARSRVIAKASDDDGDGSKDKGSARFFG